MTGLAHNEIELLENIFRQTDCVKKAVLFGSRAMGLHRHNSDVDIALYGDGITMRDILRINAKIEETTMPYMFDFVLGGNANQALSEHIRTYGKVIYRGGMRYKLGDVASFIDYRGKTPPKTPHGIPLVTAKIVKENVIQQPTEYIAVDYYDEWMRRGIPQKGAVVFTTEAPLGEVAQIKADDKLAFAQRIIVLQGEKDRLDNDFLFYSLQYELMRERIRARSTGTTVVRIKAAELRQVEIDLPDLDTQRAISATLRALDDKIAANTKLNHNLEQMAQAIFAELCSDGEPAALSDILTVCYGKNHKRLGQGEIPCLAGMNVESAVPSMTTTVLNALEIQLPNDNNLASFEETVNPMFLQIRANNIESAHIIALRDTLLPCLMSGELSVAEVAAK